MWLYGSSPLLITSYTIIPKDQTSAASENNFPSKTSGGDHLMGKTVFWLKLQEKNFVKKHSQRQLYILHFWRDRNLQFWPRVWYSAAYWLLWCPFYNRLYILIKTKVKKVKLTCVAYVWIECTPYRELSQATYWTKSKTAPIDLHETVGSPLTFSGSSKLYS